MVTVKGFIERKTKEGKSFLVLELEGGIEVVTSQTTGKPYASIKRCSIPCTFDKDTARAMIGSHLEGEIIKVNCDPYLYTNPQTNEEMTLNYSYVFQPKRIEQNMPNLSFLGELNVT